MVSQRTHEIGVCMELTEQSRQRITLVIKAKGHPAGKAEENQRAEVLTLFTGFTLR